MAHYASTIIKLAEGEVGYKEKPTNITKYAAEVDKNWPDFYNTRKQGAEWCDLFFDWLFLKSWGEATALKMLYQPKKSAGAGCPYSYNYYKAKGKVGKTPKVGCQIFFGTGKTPTHTGLVYKVDGKKVYTIEGNKSNSVKKCSYTIGSSSIFGYGYPDYDAEPAKVEPKKEEPKVSAPAKTTTTKVTTYKVTAKNGLNIRSKGTKNSTALGCMPYGSKFEVTKTQDGWAYGTYGKITGWSCMDWLSKA